MRSRLGNAIRNPKMKVIIDTGNYGFGMMEMWTDITDYVIEISGSKQKESENLGGASTDIATLTVDNSDNYFSTNKIDGLFYNKQKSNLRMAILAGFKDDVELYPYVVGYLQSMQPTWKERKYSLKLVCPMQKLKKAKSPKGTYHDVSWDDLVNELLNVSGIEKYFIRNIPKVEIRYDFFRFEEEDCFSSLKKLLEAVCGNASFDGRNFNVNTELAINYTIPTEHKHEFISDDYIEFEEVIDESDVINKVTMTCEPKQVGKLEVVASTPEHFVSVDSEPHVYDGSGFIFVDESPLFYDDSNEITIKNITTGATVEWSTWNADESRITLSDNGLLAVNTGDTLSVSYTYQQLVMLAGQEKTFSFSTEDEIDTFLEPDIVAWDSTLTNNVEYSTIANDIGKISKQSAVISEDRKSVTITLKNNTSGKVSISTFQFRGTPIRVINPIEVNIENTESIDKYDECELSITNNYINNVSIARKLSQYIIDNKSEIKKRLSIEILGYQEQQLNDVCYVKQSSSGTDHLMTIESINFTFSISNGWTANIDLLELPDSNWIYTDFTGTSNTQNNNNITQSFSYGATPPSDTNVIWIDTTDGKNVMKIYDSVTNSWISPIADNDVDLSDYPTKDEVTSDIEESRQQTYTYIDNSLVSKESIVYKQATAPTNGVNNQLWIDTSTNPYTWKKYNASTGEWEELIISGVDAEANEKIVKVEQNIDELEGVVSSKVSKTEAESLINELTADELAAVEERITTTESQIEQHADLITSKVSKTTYDVDMGNLTSRMSSAESNITQQADQISQKVSQTEFNNLGSRVSTNESNITSLTNQISLKVSSSDFNTLKTKVDNIKIGTTNIIKNSHFNEDFNNWSGINESYHSIDETGGIYGGKCAKIVGGLNVNIPITQNIITLQPNTEYTLSGWYKSDNIVLGTTNPYIRFYLYWSLNGKWVGQVISEQISGTNDWTKFIKTFTTPSSDVANGYSLSLYARDFTGTVYYDEIMLEKGNVVSDWSPHPEDSNSKVIELETRVNEAEIKLQDDRIISTVTKSSVFDVLMDSKADASELGSYATLDEVDTKIQQIDINGTVDSRLLDMINNGNSDLSLKFATKSEVTQTATSIEQNFSMANGFNLIRNSALHSGWDNWSSWGNGITIKDCYELSQYGVNNSFAFSALSDTTLQRDVFQDLNTEVGKEYTFSIYVKKTTYAAEGSSTHYGTVSVESRSGSENAGTISYTSIPDSITTNGFEIFTTTFKATTAVSRIVFGCRGGFVGEVTMFMVNEGTIPLKWNLASGELYNTNVRTDISGIKVIRRNSNGNETGYTSITPDEFAGYYDTDGDGTMEKVFYLNDDETVTKKVRATNEITMGKIKIVNCGNGWAFVKVT